MMHNIFSALVIMVPLILPIAVGYDIHTVHLDYHHDVTVEGLEDRGMFEVAAILGAQYGQGYTISCPMSADAVADWIRDTAIVPYAGKTQTLIGALS